MAYQSFDYKNRPGYIEKQSIGGGFIVVLIATCIMLIAVVISLFIAISSEKESPDNLNDNNDLSINDPDGTDDIPANIDLPESYPTIPSRDKYIASSADNVVFINEEIASSSTILVELDSYTSIVEKNADQKMYPASMTKVMTLVVAAERLTDLNAMLTVTAEIADYAEKNDGSGAGLKVGESYSVEDLMYLIAYQSDTIASILIAEHVAGSEAAFVDLMNQKADELGLVGTNFVNCTGLYNENHYSTCRDFAAIMAYAMDNQLAYSCLSSYTGRPMVVGGVECKFYCAWYSGPSRFDNNPRLKTCTVVAGKTGYTDESGITLVSVAKGNNGKTYINVIVGLPKGSGLTESKSTQEVKYIYNTYVK